MDRDPCPAIDVVTCLSPWSDAKTSYIIVSYVATMSLALRGGILHSP